MYHQTHYKLLTLTEHAEFQQLVLDLLACTGYTGLNGRDLSLVDAGRDGISYFCEEKDAWVVFSLQRQWKTRYRRDWERALDTRRPVKRFIFCTNRIIPTKEQDALIQAGAGYQIQVHFFDGDRLRQALDTACTDVRQTYLGLPDRGTMRRLIRYLVADPENEVADLPQPSVEALLPASRVARGLYTLLRTEELTEICENGEELRALTAVLDAYVEFRRAATAAESRARIAVPGSTPDQVVAMFRKLDPAAQPELAERWHRVMSAAEAVKEAVRLVESTATLAATPRLAADFPLAEPLPFGDAMNLEHLPPLSADPNRSVRGGFREGESSSGA